jgi:signal transduction histidine kinase
LATKLKNNIYPAIVWALLLVFTAVTLLSGWDVFAHRAYLDTSYYFKSRAFYNQVDTHWNLVKYVHLDNKNYTQLTREEKLNSEWINSLKKSYAEQKKEREMEINASYTPNMDETGQPVPKNTQQSKDKIAQAGARIDAMLENDMNKYLAYKEQEYQAVKRSLDDREAVFKYYIKDLGSGEVYTNMPNTPNQGKQTGQALNTIVLPLNDVADQALQPMNRYFQQNRLEGTFFIPAVVNEFSQVHADYAYYLSIRDRIIKESVLFGVSLLLMIALFLVSRKFSRYSIPWADSLAAGNRAIPADVRIILLVLIGMCAFGYVNPSTLFQLSVYPGHVLQILLFSLLVALVMMQLKEALFLYRDKDELRQQWKATYFYRMKQLISNDRGMRNIFFKVVLVMISTLLLVICGFFGASGIADGAGGAISISTGYFLLYLIVVLPYILRRFVALSSILAGAEAIAAGNFNHPIEAKGSGNLSQLAHHLNNMKASFKTSLEHQMKSERLKTELITNVSHDLKTPLTSIINYVDLLKNENITQVQRDSYMQVLERKTQRLKVLIDDLFEASKMASGSAELTLESVNVTSLLNQAMAELSEQIEASSLSFKVSVPDHKVDAWLDGKKIWRVFENLIGNALKYAMPNSRVHISLIQSEGKIVFTIKNVSAYEIDFEVSELLERFKRGDSSRHTEGSGLGLAIAKSIIDLHAGELLIQIDGDYFKVIVILDVNRPH